MYRCFPCSQTHRPGGAARFSSTTAANKSQIRVYAGESEWRGFRYISDQSNTGEFLTATTPDGMLIIHNFPITLSWVPRDVVNNVYNFGGIVTVGTFDSTEDAKRVAKERHSVPLQEWRVGDYLEFERNLSRVEVHTPDIEAAFGQ